MNAIKHGALVALLGFADVASARPTPTSAYTSTVPDNLYMSIAALSGSARADLEHRIDAVANEVANKKAYFDPDKRPIIMRSSLDPISGNLVMFMEDRFGPLSGYFEIEDLEADVTDAVRPLIDHLEKIEWFDWRFGGKDMYFWFPEQKPAEPTVHKQLAPGGKDPGSVLISEGHGYYYNHTYSDWRHQRELVNGILEDEITVALAGPLAYLMGAEHIGVNFVRRSARGVHEPSGRPMMTMGARYVIQDLLPDRTDIWHAKPDDTSAMREYAEDILSRPLYANHLGVDALISLHTNASDNPSASGARAVVQQAGSESANLAKMLLCYMSEQVHAEQAYHEFPVARDPSVYNKGENRLATMPAVIVELAFHTNPSDAAALKDPLIALGVSSTKTLSG